MNHELQSLAAQVFQLDYERVEILSRLNLADKSDHGLAALHGVSGVLENLESIRAELARVDARRVNLMQELRRAAQAEYTERLKKLNSEQLKLTHEINRLQRSGPERIVQEALNASSGALNLAAA